MRIRRSLQALSMILFFVVIIGCSTTVEPEQALAEAEKDYQEGRVEDALDGAKEIMEAEPAPVGGRILAARCYLDLEQPDEAFALLLEPDLPPWQRQICLAKAADLAMELGQPSLAVGYLRRACELAPDDVDLLIRVGEAEGAASFENDAIRTFKKTMALGGDRKRIVPVYARVLWVLEQYEEGAALLESELDPEEMGASEKVLLGNFMCRLKRVEEGLALFREAAAMDEGLTEAYFNQGCALEAMKDTAGAEKAYRFALRVDPTYGPAYFNLGCLLLRDGRRYEGRAFVKAAATLEKDPLKKRAMEATEERLLQGDGSKD